MLGEKKACLLKQLGTKIRSTAARLVRSVGNLADFSVQRKSLGAFFQRFSPPPFTINEQNKLCFSLSPLTSQPCPLPRPNAILCQKKNKTFCCCRAFSAGPSENCCLAGRRAGKEASRAPHFCTSPHQCPPIPKLLSTNFLSKSFTSQKSLQPRFGARESKPYKKLGFGLIDPENWKVLNHSHTPQIPPGEIHWISIASYSESPLNLLPPANRLLTSSMVMVVLRRRRERKTPHFQIRAGIPQAGSPPQVLASSKWIYCLPPTQPFCSILSPSESNMSVRSSSWRKS